MCGIIGITSTSDVAPKLAQGVRRLEYRGYDSVGVATLDNGAIEVRKGVGKVDQVDSELAFDTAAGVVGIAHCRWGTHGGITREKRTPPPRTLRPNRHRPQRHHRELPGTQAAIAR